MNIYYNGSTHVVANDATEALEVYADHIGDRPDRMESKFAEVEYDVVISIFVNESGSICSQWDDDCPSDPIDFTAEEWLERELPKHDGKAFVLCCEDA